jgi:predicted nucleotidyltransferase component of viral defense system
VTSGPIKPVLLEVQEALDGWLGQPKSQQTRESVKLLYGFETTAQPVRRMRVKIEINTREHFAVGGLHHVSFAVRNPWYAATTPITTYVIEELMATKLRALHQRRKGRDLYDLWLALQTLSPNEDHVIACFLAYLEHGGLSISRAQYEASMAQKLLSADFRNDVIPLLRDESGYDIDEAYGLVRQRLISRIPGEPWKGLP